MRELNPRANIPIAGWNSHRGRVTGAQTKQVDAAAATDVVIAAARADIYIHPN
jgi:hypothetical protein